MDHPHRSFILWNRQHVLLLEDILSHLISLRNDAGAIRYSSNPQSGYGPWQTIEGLIPFVLFPERERFIEDIIMMSHYVLEQQDPHDGGIPPSPEYPSWEHGAVDSTADAIYVFVLLRNFLRSTSSLREKYKDFCQEVDAAIKRAVEFIARNRNPDNGWGFIRSDELGLKSRTYSTCLSVSSLSYVRDSDCESSGISKRELLSGGVDYLLAKQIKDGPNRGAWSFSEEDNVPNQNITAFTIWALTATYIYERDERVEQAIDIGVKYIVRNWKAEHIAENVRYPVSIGADSISTHRFILPYYIIISAILLSGECGYKDNRIVEMVTNIEKEYRNKVQLYRTQPLSNRVILFSWELAAKFFGIISYYSVHNAVENCTLLFATAHHTHLSLVQAEAKIDQLSRNLRVAEHRIRRILWSLLLTTALIIILWINPTLVRWLQDRGLTLVTTILLVIIIPFAISLGANLATPTFHKQLADLMKRIRTGNPKQ